MLPGLMQRFWGGIFGFVFGFTQVTSFMWPESENLPGIAYSFPASVQRLLKKAVWSKQTALKHMVLIVTSRKRKCSTFGPEAYGP